MNALGFGIFPILTVLFYLIPVGLACYLMIVAIKALKIYIAKNSNDYQPKV